MQTALTFELTPALELLTVQAFLKSVEDVLRLVKSVDYAATGDRNGRRWLVDGLHSSAPTVTIRPAVDGSQTVRQVVDGLRVLSAPDLPAEPPPGFSADALDDLIRLRQRFRGETPLQQIVFSAAGMEPATVTRAITASVERLRSGGRRSLGSVEGTLDAVNLHGRPSCTVWDRLTRRPVRCWFPNTPEWKARVKLLLEQRVLVTGRVQYYSKGGPYTVDEIRDIRDVTPDPLLPRATFGSIPHLTGEQETMDYLKATRE